MNFNWFEDVTYVEESSKKKLPLKDRKNILITSALPYVNNVPHLGNIIGSVLSADAFSRFCKIMGYQSLFICGTDEYGTATEMKALKEGLTPRQVCDKFHQLHKGIYEWFNIGFDHFGRTTTESQTEITQDIFLKIYKNGYTSTSTLSQLHCEKCNIFLADRFVFGICPKCKFIDARGDQCDGCSKLLDAINLIDPRCYLCQETPKVKESKHIFLDLDRLSNKVEVYINKVISDKNSHWSNNAISIIRSWIKVGLEKRCITRDLKWGIPIPLEDFASKVFYVWFDAPVGYLSITKELLNDDWTKWWKNPNEVELYHFLGKDNVAFHGIIFPAAQIAADDGFTKVSHICATEYLNYEDQKFSKSRNIGVFGDTASQTTIPADVWRFYLIYMRPESQDTVFSWDDFFLKVNSELLANLGNFVLRGLSFIIKYFDSKQPAISLTTVEETFIQSVNCEYKLFLESFIKIKLRDALTHVLAVSKLGNQYMQNNKPWELIKGSEEEMKRAGTIIATISNTVVLLSVMLYPFMPSTCIEIQRQCNLTKLIALPKNFIQFLKEGHLILQPVALFTKIEIGQIEQYKAQFGSSNETVSELKNETFKKVKKNIKEPKENNKKSLKMIEQQTKNLKDQFPLIESKHPEILEAQSKIDLYLKNIEKEFNITKSSFLAKKLSLIENQNKKLCKEIEGLKIKLGFDQKIKPLKSVLETKESVKKPNKLLSEEKVVSTTVDNDVDVGRLDLRVGRIVEAKKHPDADTLYVETIDLGEEKPRTVVSGLVKFVPIDQMENRLVVCLCNLKPVKMRGIESQAMVMCASTPEKVEIMEVDQSCKPGDRISTSKYILRPDAILNPKKKIWEKIAPDLKVDSNGLATYKGEALKINETSYMTAPTLRNVQVK